MCAKIKIYVSCHKESYVSDNPLLFPIQVGAALSKQHFPNMLHDDVGENISDKNKSYCELTAQYWAWKHEDADYYGFFHYRRYFSFSNEKLPVDCHENVIFPYIDKKVEKQIGLDESTMRQAIEEADVLVPIPYNIKAMGYENVYNQYKTADSQYSKDLDIALDVIREKYPYMINSTDKYMNSGFGYICNMFIMKKNIFNDYCSWLFDVLGEVEERANFEHYSDYAYRVIGFISERLLGVYITYLRNEKQYKVKEVQKVLFGNTNADRMISPAFIKNNVPIVLSMSNDYALVTGVAVKSICQNATKDYNYDIIIMEYNLSNDQKAQIEETVTSIENVSLRFFNFERFIYTSFSERERGLVTNGTIRFFLPQLLPLYDKVIYLDSDVIVEGDLGLLYQTEIGENLIAGCRDIDVIASYNTAENPYTEYLDRVINLDQPYDFIQVGVLIMNLKDAREKWTIDRLVIHLSAPEYRHHVRDALNSLVDKKRLILDMKWNFIACSSNNYREISRKNVFWNLPREIAAEYVSAKRAPSIIHYAGDFKPWQNPNCEMANSFWKYARTQSYYEALVLNMSENLMNWKSMGYVKNNQQVRLSVRIARKFLPERVVLRISKFKRKIMRK